MSLRAPRGLTALATLVVATTLAGCEGRTKVNRPEAPKLPTTGPALAVLDFSAGVPEVAPENVLGFAPKKPTFDLALRTIERVRTDTNSKGLFVRFGSTHMGFAHAEELSAALARVRAEKPIHCHAEGFNNASYMVAVKGCTKISVAPAGDLDTIGIAAQIVYLRKLLVEELKLSVDILQVGKYKGAEEPLTRDGPSPEARASLEGVLVDLRAAWLEGFRTGTKPAVVDHVEQGPYNAFKAKERGLIDDIAYFDDAKEKARAEVGAVRDEVRFGPHAKKGDGDLSDIVRVMTGEQATAPVALIRAVGSIRMGGEGGGLFGDGGGITDKGLGKHLARVEKDNNIQALVLRIDSPGGSALASDLLWHQLMRIREVAKKPIVVSVGEMAASGGYYLASTGNLIVADASSIVGSIGVVGGKIGFGDGLERFGIHAETFPAKKGDPEAAVRAAYISPFIKWDDPTRERIRESMTGIYDLFLRRVSEGRKIPVEEVAKSAEGQIFSGREGQKRKLVDEIGGLSLAIAKARELAQLPETAKLVILEDRPSFLDILGDDDESETQAIGPKSPVRAAAGEALEHLAPDARTFLETLAPLAGSEHMVLAPGYGLTLR